MKIAILGNMNNNAVNLARFLQDEGLDCTVVFYANEAAHFTPEADSIGGVAYGSQTVHWGGYLDYFRTSAATINKDLDRFDFVIGARLAPAYLLKAQRPLDIFMPTGGDLHTLPFFNTWRPRDLVKWAGFSHIQREAIRQVKCLYWDDTNPRVDTMIAPFTHHLDRIKQAIPCLYYPDFQGENLEHRKANSRWLHKFKEARASTDVLLFHHVKHVWTRDAIRFYGAFHEKGNDQIIHGLRAYRDSNTSVDIKIAMFEYGHDHGATRALAKSLGVDGQIIWFPQLPRKELMLGMGEADAVIGEVTHSWFSYGTVFEAMAMGKTVLHHRNDQLYPDKSLYPMIHITDATTIADAFRAIADHRYDLHTMGQQAFEWLKSTGMGAGVREIVRRTRSTH